MTIALCLTIRPQFATECPRRSNQQGWVTFGAKFGNEVRCKPKFNAIWGMHGLSYRPTQNKLSFRYLLPFEHNARTWQTDKQSDRPRNGSITTI